MKVELKKVQHFPAGSEETECFTAELWVNGLRRGNVSNDGHGGSHRFTDYSAEIELREATADRDADTYVNEAFQLALDEKAMTRLLKKRAVYVERETGFLLSINLGAGREIETMQPKLETLGRVVLNGLPKAQALDLYRHFAGALG